MHSIVPWSDPAEAHRILKCAQTCWKQRLFLVRYIYILINRDRGKNNANLDASLARKTRARGAESPARPCLLLLAYVYIYSWTLQESTTKTLTTQQNSPSMSATTALWVPEDWGVAMSEFYAIPKKKRVDKKKTKKNKHLPKGFKLDARNLATREAHASACGPSLFSSRVEL